MDTDTLLKAQVQAKRIYRLLTEVQDLSSQLAEALDREDQVTVRMLISMRNDPVNQLRQAKTALEELRDDLPTPEAQRLRELLNGGAAASPEEEGLSAQVQTNRRLWERVMALDKGLSLKLGHHHSIYHRS